MRPMEFWALPALFFAAAVPSIMLSRTQKTEDKTRGPQRNAPRASADSYRSHARRDGISVGAEILTPEQVRKVFVSDLNRCCRPTFSR